MVAQARAQLTFNATGTRATIVTTRTNSDTQKRREKKLLRTLKVRWATCSSGDSLGGRDFIHALRVPMEGWEAMAGDVLQFP